MLRRAALVVAVLGMAACGGGSSDTGSDPGDVTFGDASGGISPAIVPANAGGAQPGSLEVQAQSASSPLPEVVVRNVATGELLQLKNLLPRSKPLLVWFWAPH